MDHDILSKLRSLGLNEMMVKWFIFDRTQMLMGLSGAMRVTCGMPQFSILGPLLFLIYVNGISAAVSCNLLLYVDDSALIVSGKNTGSVEEALSKELDSVREWLINNKLSLHLSKTKSIILEQSKG